MLFKKIKVWVGLVWVSRLTAVTGQGWAESSGAGLVAPDVWDMEGLCRERYILWWCIHQDSKVTILTGNMETQMVKNLPAMQEAGVQSLGWEDPLEEGMATHSSILAWRIPWTEEPCGLQTKESQRVRYDWVTDIHMCHQNPNLCVYVGRQVTQTDKYQVKGKGPCPKGELPNHIIMQHLLIALARIQKRESMCV